LVRAFGSHPRGHWFKSSIAQYKEDLEKAENSNMQLSGTKQDMTKSCRGARGWKNQAQSQA
ncbi:MAG: hypothetical protein JSU69_01615, partial [Candidatus Zixiibacteriota bacterium]